MKRRWARGKKAYGICDRTGFKVPYRRLVKEPGTGLMVDRLWSDGRWNIVDHPQNFPSDVSEAISLQNPRPDIKHPQVNFLSDENGNIVFGPDNRPILME